ncbi:Hopanoid-associated RND transporter, HpnN [Candidatus Paraburkholderia kirkii]|nr:Hopanoid-associated RND transporter, HpnN [Candidatus Paraburkholderia kirkii]
MLDTTLNLPLLTGQVNLGQMAGLLNKSAAVLDEVLANRPAAFSWRDLADSSKSDAPGRAFVTVLPELNFNALKAAAGTSEEIRAKAAEIGIDKKYGATLHLTDTQPLADEEFASVQDGATLNGALTFLVVLMILWVALRSKRMTFAVFVTLFVGLAITAVLGLMMVHALNMIPVAFMVLFVGLGMDFGIQFGVKYREERYKHKRLDVSLTLAATATAASFFSFLPTAYRGVSELGLIAGVGMFVAYVTNMTLLPALIKVFAPPGEAHSPGFPVLAPVDEFLDRHRKPVLIGTLAVVISALPLLFQLRFDFNPLHLKDPHTESMMALTSLKDSPEGAVDDVAVLAPSLAAADRIAAKLQALPEVERATMLTSLIPADQPKKLELVKAAADQLLPALDQQTASPVTDEVRVAALKRVSSQLSLAADEHPGAGEKEAKHLSQTLAKLAQADAAARERAEHAMAEPLRLALAQLRALLTPTEITRATLPPQMVETWVTPKGQALVDVSPKTPPDVDPNDDALLARFADAVQKAEPDAIGGPISVRHSAETVIKAFQQAALYSLVAISALLWIALRRFGDVMRTLVPLFVSAIVTLELCVVFRMPRSTSRTSSRCRSCCASAWRSRSIS